jgi:WD40 repeat protein
MRIAVALTVGICLASLAPPSSAQEKPQLVFDSGGHTGRIRAFSFTPDGKQLVSASEDKTVRVWDIDSTACLRVIRPPIGPTDEGALYAGALSPDGKTFAVAGFGYKGPYVPIYLVDLATGEIAAALSGHTNSVYCLAFAPGGKQLASGGVDRALRIWNVETRECVATLTGHKGSINGVTFSPDGKRVASAANDQTARIWDLKDAEKSVLLPGHTANPLCIAWSPDGAAIATGSGDQTIRLFNPRGEPINTYAKLGHEINGIQFTGDSKQLLFSRGAGGTARDCSLQDAATGTIVWDYTSPNNICFAVAINPKRPIGAVSSNTGEIFLMDVASGKHVARLGGASRMSLGVGWSADGKTLGWGATYMGFNQNKVERAFHLFTDRLNDDPTGEFIYSRTTLNGAKLERLSNTQVRAVDAEGTAVTLTMPQSSDIVQAFTFLRDGEALVGSSLALVRFDTRNGKPLQTYAGHIGAVNAVAVAPDGRMFATAGNDHTVRIWRPDRPNPLVSYFFVRNEWIAWTAGGYYASSPGGESMMGWLLGRGKDKTGFYCPSAQVRKKLYRPELIKLLLETGDLQEALARLAIVTKNLEPATNIVQVLPPTVAITTPEKHPLTTEDEVFELTAVAQSTGEHPVLSLRVLLDGRPYPGKHGETAISPPKTGKVSAGWKLQLPPGEHEIVVQADSPVSKGTSMPITVRRMARSFTPIKPDPKAAPKPALYVLSVGISDYKGKLKLDYAARDAQVFGEVLASTGKPLFKDIQTKPLLDKAATREGMIDGLKWLRREATQDDICVVFFAGHGERDGDSGSYYLMPHDADPQKVALTGFSGNDLKAFLTMLPARRVLVILDTCHAGAFAGGDKKRSIPEDVIRDLASTDVGVVVMASSMAGEESLESKDHKHGYFTLAVVEGLKGEAANKEGIVYLSDLDAYVTQRVKTLTKGQQHPVINRPIRSIPLAAPKLVVKKAA